MINVILLFNIYVNLTFIFYDKITYNTYNCMFIFKFLTLDNINYKYLQIFKSRFISVNFVNTNILLKIFFNIAKIGNLAIWWIIIVYILEFIRVQNVVTVSKPYT